MAITQQTNTDNRLGSLLFGFMILGQLCSCAQRDAVSHFAKPLTSGNNRPFSSSEKESQSNDTLLHFVDFSNVDNCDRSSNATRSNLVYKNV